MRWEGGGAHQAVHHLEWEGLTRQYFTWRGGEMGRGRGSPGNTSLGGG